MSVLIALVSCIVSRAEDVSCRRQSPVVHLRILLVSAVVLTGVSACHRRTPVTTTESPTEAVQISKSAAGLDAQVVGFGRGAVELGYEATFIGSEQCGSCHVEHYASAKVNHMATTSRRVTSRNQDLWFAPESLAKPVKWPRSQAFARPRYRRDPAGVFLEIHDERGAMHRTRVAAVFGSGNRGFTPLSAEEGRGIRELRLSYFRSGDHWRMTPGSRDDPDPLGYVRSAEGSEFCLKCHTTALAFREDRLDLENSVFGIGCERCHGPGSAHVKAVDEGADSWAIFNPGSLDNQDQVRFCGQCHRRPADAEPDRVLRHAADLARHAGTGLMLSACFRRSPPSSITCLDCHDPHINIDDSRDFNRPCLRCHKRPGEDHTAENISGSSDCVKCHMRVETESFFGLKFTEHWIRVPDRPPPIATAERDEYARYLEASYRAAIARPGLGEERQSKLRMRLGKLLFRQGAEESGLGWMRQALSFDPLYKDRILTAEYHQRAGKSAEAIAILSETIRLVPEHNRAYYTLAHIHLSAGTFDLAEAALEAWGKARPGDPVLLEARDELKRTRRRAREGANRDVR